MKTKKIPNKKLGERVRELRKASNLTQEQLADKLNFSGKYIGDLEKGRRNITPQTAQLMANLFGCDPKYLLDENVTDKSTIDTLNKALTQITYESHLMINAIISLAELNGYEVEVMDMWKSNSLHESFSKMNEYIIFNKNGEKEFSMSLKEAILFGNNLSSIFEANIKFINDWR